MFSIPTHYSFDSLHHKETFGGHERDHMPEDGVGMICAFLRSPLCRQVPAEGLSSARAGESAGCEAVEMAKGV